MLLVTTKPHTVYYTLIFEKHLLAFVVISLDLTQNHPVAFYFGCFPMGGSESFESVGWTTLLSVCQGIQLPADFLI